MVYGGVRRTRRSTLVRRASQSIKPNPKSLGLSPGLDTYCTVVPSE